MFLLPHQTDRIMDTDFTSEGVIRLNTLEETDFEEIPILRQVQCLCRHIHNENGRLKLTPNGNLPLGDVSSSARYLPVSGGTRSVTLSCHFLYKDAIRDQRRVINHNRCVIKSSN